MTESRGPPPSSPALAHSSDPRHDPHPQAWALQAQPTPIPDPNARLPLGFQMIPDGRLSAPGPGAFPRPQVLSSRPPSRPQTRLPTFRYDTGTPGAPDPKAQVTSPTPGGGNRSPDGRPPRPGTVPHPGSQAHSPRPSPTAGSVPRPPNGGAWTPDPRAFPSYQAPVPPRPWAPTPTSGSGSPSRMVIHPPGVRAPLGRRPGEA